MLFPDLYVSYHINLCQAHSWKENTTWKHHNHIKGAIKIRTVRRRMGARKRIPAGPLREESPTFAPCRFCRLHKMKFKKPTGNAGVIRPPRRGAWQVDISFSRREIPETVFITVPSIRVKQEWRESTLLRKNEPRVRWARIRETSVEFMAVEITRIKGNELL